MKIVLTCLPVFNHVFTPPLSLAYLKACLGQCAGVQVKVLDLEVSYFYSPEIKRDSILYWDKIWHRDYDLKQETLFKNPDIWESGDGKNSFQWRKSLLEKIRGYLSDFGIPMVDFVFDGNPRILEDRSNKLFEKITKEHNNGVVFQKSLDKISLAGDYISNLKYLMERCPKGSI